MSLAPARAATLKVLARVRRDGAFAGAVLSSELNRRTLASGDVGLTTRLVYGVLASEGVLDEVVDRFVRTPPEPLVRDILRLAAFELLFSDVPVYAVVDQAVTATRAVRPRAAGLVNAVSRRIAEVAPGFPWGDPHTDRNALARASRCPDWVVDEYLASLGESAGIEALLASAEEAPTYVRLDPFAVSREVAIDALQEAAPAASPPDPDCLRLGNPSAAFRDGAVHPAWFAMDAAAQMAPAACAPARGERVLDAGAGRGNKTICLQALAIRTGGPAHITAVEMHEGKAQRLSERLAESGVPGVDVVCADGREAHKMFDADSFDAVLLDAPCSGLGTLRRYPEKRWRLEQGDLARMPVLQLDLLEALASVVRPGGRVVYSTCSVANAENGGVVDAFLAGEHGRWFELESPTPHVPPEWARFLDERGAFRSWPVSGGPDGHYVAVLRRTSA